MTCEAMTPRQKRRLRIYQNAVLIPMSITIGIACLLFAEISPVLSVTFFTAFVYLFGASSWFEGKGHPHPETARKWAEKWPK